MLPLPEAINTGIALPLQLIAASGSSFLLQLLGLWAVQEGNVINLRTAYEGMERLDVAAACNGLKMLMTLTATITATIILVPLPTWKRIVLLVCIVPIALISNMTRIVATGLCYYWIEGPTAKDWAHDVSGWLMMPMALVLVGLELGILSWLVPTETECVRSRRTEVDVEPVEREESGSRSPNPKRAGIRRCDRLTLASRRDWLFPRLCPRASRRNLSAWSRA